jgi:hypothetical protein
MGRSAEGSSPAASPLANSSFLEELALKPRSSLQERNKVVVAGYDQRQLRAAEDSLTAQISSHDGHGHVPSSTRALPKTKLGIQRKELSNSVELESSVPSVARAAQGNALNVVALEAEIDPLQARILDDNHLLLFRKAWRNGRRYLQGVVVRHREFIEV